METIDLAILSDANQEQLCGGVGEFGGVIGNAQKIVKHEFGVPLPLYVMDQGYEPSFLGRAIGEDTQNPCYGGCPTT